MALPSYWELRNRARRIKAGNAELGVFNDDIYGDDLEAQLLSQQLKRGQAPKAAWFKSLFDLHGWRSWIANRHLMGNGTDPPPFEIAEGMPGYEKINDNPARGNENIYLYASSRWLILM